MFGWLRRRQGAPAEQELEQEAWWNDQVKSALEESREIDLTLFHDFLETEVVHFQSLEQEWRVLPPTMVTRPRRIL